MAVFAIPASASGSPPARTAAHKPVTSLTTEFSTRLQRVRWEIFHQFPRFPDPSHDSTTSLTTPAAAAAQSKPPKLDNRSLTTKPSMQFLLMYVEGPTSSITLPAPNTARAAQACTVPPFPTCISCCQRFHTSNVQNATPPTAPSLPDDRAVKPNV